MTVPAGGIAHVEVRTQLAVKPRAFLNKHGKHRVGLVFVAEKKLGNTLYRGGKRIAITRQCLAAEGEVLDEGTMGYG